MKNFFFILALIFLLQYLFSSSVLGVTVTINNYPQTITDEPFTLTASVSGATAGTNYLRVDLFKDQTTNYFGETYNNSDYYGGSTFSQYLPITIVSGTTWGGNIQARVGSPSSTDYDWTGTYKLRLRRYTSGGGYTTSEANSSAVTIAITLPSPSISPSPSIAPSPSPTTTTAQSPSPVASVKPTPSPSPSISPTPKPSIKPTPLENIATDEAMVLGVNTLASNVLDEKNIEKDSTESSQSDNSNSGIFGISPLFLGLVGGGVILLSISGYLFFKGSRFGKIDTNA